MIDWLEIRDDKHLMSAEGTATDKPSEFYVEDEIRKRGYRCENISISHDGLQQTWRFTARLLDT
jgi:hypothetical protein